MTGTAEAPEGTGALTRRIARIAIPAAGALGAAPLYGLADSAIIGRLSPTALASLGVATGVLTPLTWLFAFLESTTVTRVARFRGDGDTDGQGRTIVDAVVLALIIGFALLILVALAAQPLAWLMSGRGEVLEGAVTYLRITALGFPLVFLAQVGHGDLQGSDRMARSLAIVVVSNVLNVVLDLWFVHGLGWGLRGSAWGSVIAQALTIVVFAELFRRGGLRRRPSLARMKLVVRDGTHLVTRTLGIAGVFACATAAATRMGTTEGAAHQITNQLFNFLALTLDALALAGQVLVAERLGARDHDGASLLTRVLLRITVGFGLAVAVIVMATSPWIPHLFSANDGVRSVASRAILMLGILCVPGAIAFLYDGIYQGTADYGWLVKGTLIAAVVFVPAWVVLMLRPSLGLTALWAALTAWMCARAILQHRHLSSGRWLVAATRPLDAV